MPRLVGINHVALEVGDLEQALAFYGSLFELHGVEREPGMLFLEMGDQFLALNQGESRHRNRARHFGLVVDDKEVVRETLRAHGVEILPGPRLDFLDPWGNRIQVVDYRDIRFAKTETILQSMGLGELRKRDQDTR